MQRLNNFEKNNIYRAFTLVEVLVTLTVIGVVAVITLNIINSIQEGQFKEAAKEAYSKSSQALEQMKVDNGGTVNAYMASQTFKPVFMTYFKTIKDCGFYSCVIGDAGGGFNSSIYFALAGGNGRITMMDDGQFITSDGVFYAIENGGSLIFITVDVNGYLKKPNTYGKDIFLFQVLNDNLVPMGGPGTNYPAATYCDKTNALAWQGLGCMYYVMKNINY